ncbi:MAG: hypothetical protein H7039_18540 [Bryobacteraceae bacterium]|nr:hypothetical protein [Bryobacteraceae bacterium]
MINSFTLLRAVRGPIVLIALGLLFLMDQQDVAAFRRTWPILLILFGVFKLAERLLAPPQVPPAYYGPPTGGNWTPPASPQGGTQA